MYITEPGIMACWQYMYIPTKWAACFTSSVDSELRFDAILWPAVRATSVASLSFITVCDSVDR
jgi:hypothetical protein